MTVFGSYQQNLVPLVLEAPRDVHDRLAVIEVELDRIAVLDLVHRKLGLHEIQGAANAPKVEEILLYSG